MDDGPGRARQQRAPRVRPAGGPRAHTILPVVRRPEPPVAPPRLPVIAP